jgi:leader peptidase (prepilin peptidase)/N-methyltransferase
MLLSKRIVYPTLAVVSVLLVVASARTGHWSRLGTAAACGAVAFAFFFLLNFVNPRWMAVGDVRLVLLIGVGVGWLGPGTALLAFFPGFLLGAVIGVALIAAKKLGPKSPVPFGVFLAAGATLAVYLGEPILRWYHR